ncbi:hypothetical protein BV20DRAFT_951200 [Pilatotrama ljubarskyi]|nr:hypothetical protein BV20DRAFT_951200 [Pilatotrama ljubarskyi]
MTSATYIPLSQISPDEFAWTPKRPPQPSFRAHFTRRRAIYALVAATSLLTFIVFLKVSAGHHDDYDYEDYDLHIDPHYQPSYIAIPVPDSLPQAARPTLRPVRDLPSHCLDAYYSSGQLCHDSFGPIPMDVVWTWVNGSDPLFTDARDRAVSRFTDDDPYRPIKKNNPSRMFRDHDELRHSVRSVLDNFRPYTNRFRILTSDFYYPEKDFSNQSFPDPGPGYWRLGLQPQWLQTSDYSTPWQDGNVQLSLTHHAHFFEPYNDTIFNSYAIESQFSHLQDVSESFIYMNDDFYMMTPLTPASFYTSPYGIVLRLQEGLQVSPDKPDDHVQGEWRSMGESNWLLSNRFGARHRPYVVHEAKAVSFAMIQELALVWPDAIAKTATHAFRETEGGDGDFYNMFMHAHYIVERAREALLWSWTVGRIGGLDDTWGEEQTARAWRELGGLDDGSNELHVESYPRETLDPVRVAANLKEAGYETNIRTVYQFSSLDGYAYGHFGLKGSRGWPSFTLNDTRPACTMKRDECFNVKGADGGPAGASDVFKHIAFDRYECGDCMMLALVKASGPLGLSAFLPSEERRVPIEDPLPGPEGFIPHLPLVSDWHDGRFALRDVMKDAHTTSVRDWSLMLLQRYRYIIGDTPSVFERLLSLPQVRNALKVIDANSELALLCVNDDLRKDDPHVSKLFLGWQEKRWPQPAAWEADAST